MSGNATTTVSSFIDAPPPAVYRAFLDPQAVAVWLPPGSMRGVVHAFDAHEGGAFSMSLVYPADDASQQGKTSADTDRFEGRFARLVADREVVWETVFDSSDPAFAGEMTVRTTLEPEAGGTRVTMTCENIPPGVRLEDNEAGSRQTLEQLASYLGAPRTGRPEEEEPGR